MALTRGPGAGHAIAYIAWVSLLGGLSAEQDRKACKLHHGENEFPKPVTSLTFCQQFRRRTCCNKTHTDRLRRQALSYFDQEVPDECRTIASKVLCSECEPAMGTGERQGICRSLCDSWYSSCKDAMFTLSSSNKYIPCTFNSLLCWPLGDVLKSGKELCEKHSMVVLDDPQLCYGGKMHPKYQKEVKKERAKANHNARSRYRWWDRLPQPLPKLILALGLATVITGIVSLLLV
ncbi:hypothetical protein AAMO2058_001104300 [Amorphochlora amoebiformis]